MASEASELLEPSNLVPDRVVLQSTPGGADALADRARAAGHEVIDTLASVDTVVVRTSDPDALVRAAGSWPEALAAAQDQYADLQFQVTNDDRETDSQWALDTVGLREAWHRARGASTTPTIAILDTGVDATHPDLSAALWVDPATGFKGRDMVSPGLSPDDDIPACGGHGTHVAGIAGAIRDNGIGVAGAAPVEIMNLQVFHLTTSGDCRAPRSAVTSAIVYAADNGADVISMSLGSVQSSPVGSISSVDYAWSKDVMVVAAAGNDGCSGCHHWPSDGNNVVSVANMDTPYSLNPSSNHGPHVDIAAPGTSIRSTCVGGGYCTKTGTSMAAPLVAGVLALEKSYRPTWSAASIVHRMELTAIDLGATGRDDGFGHGKIDADSLLAALPSGTIYYHRISHANAMQLDVHDWLRWTRTVTPGREQLTLDLTWDGSGFTGNNIEVRITTLAGDEVAAWMEDDGLIRASFGLPPGDYHIYLYGRYATQIDYWFEVRDYPGNSGTAFSAPHKLMLAGAPVTFNPSGLMQLTDTVGSLAFSSFDAVPDDPSVSYLRGVAALPAGTSMQATVQMNHRDRGTTGVLLHQYEVTVLDPTGTVIHASSFTGSDVETVSFTTGAAGDYQFRIHYESGLDGEAQLEVRAV